MSNFNFRINDKLIAANNEHVTTPSALADLLDDPSKIDALNTSVNDHIASEQGGEPVGEGNNYKVILPISEEGNERNTIGFATLVSDGTEKRALITMIIGQNAESLGLTQTTARAYEIQTAYVSENELPERQVDIFNSNSLNLHDGFRTLDMSGERSESGSFRQRLLGGIPTPTAPEFEKSGYNASLMLFGYAVAAALVIATIGTLLSMSTDSIPFGIGNFMENLNLGNLFSDGWAGSDVKWGQPNLEVMRPALSSTALLMGGIGAYKTGAFSQAVDAAKDTAAEAKKEWTPKSHTA